MRRVARRRVVAVNADPAEAERFRLTHEYLLAFLDLIPARYRVEGEWRRELGDLLGGATLTAIPIPHDCKDGFYGAFWRRPAAYLDPRVRARISVFAILHPDYLEAALRRLREDIESGAWCEHHRELAARSELDLGYCVVVAELGEPKGGADAGEGLRRTPSLL